MEIMYYHQLYFGPSLVSKERKGILAFLDKLLKKEQNNREKKLVEDFETLELDKSIYVLVVSPYEHHQIEIFKTHYLKQDYFQDQSLKVVGFAQGYQEAKELVQEMMEDTLIKTGSFYLKKLFVNQAFTHSPS